MAQVQRQGKAPHPNPLPGERGKKGPGTINVTVHQDTTILRDDPVLEDALAQG